jgi:hypothetical protein
MLILAYKGGFDKSNPYRKTRGFDESNPYVNIKNVGLINQTAAAFRIRILPCKEMIENLKSKKWARSIVLKEALGR